MYCSKNNNAVFAFLLGMSLVACVTTSDTGPRDVPALVFLSPDRDLEAQSPRYVRVEGNPPEHYLWMPSMAEFDASKCRPRNESGMRLCPAGFEKLEIIARKVHDRICSKTSDQKLTAHITAVLPSTPAGLALDVAQVQQKKSREIVAKAAKTFFTPLQVRYPEYRPNSPRWRVPSGNRLDVVNYFKKQKLDLNDNAARSEESDLYTFYQIGGNFFLTLSAQVWKPELLLCSPSESALYKKLEGSEVGCRATNLGEMFYLTGLYTFTPAGTSPQDAIENRDDLWKQYIQTYTEVTEVKGSDPSVIDYQINLNFKRFCESGVNVGDLKSK